MQLARAWEFFKENGGKSAVRQGNEMRLQILLLWKRIASKQLGVIHLVGTQNFSKKLILRTTDKNTHKCT